MTAERTALAVVPVRDGVLPAGADEAAAEAGGRVLLVGSGAADSAAALTASLSHVLVAEAGAFAPAAWARALAPVIASEQVVILPASPDGRDLAPRLAHAAGRPLVAGAVEVGPERAVVARGGGLTTQQVAIDEPVVATLVPGVRGVGTRPPGQTCPRPVPVAFDLEGAAPDPDVLEITPPDPATMDLAESPFIVGGGAGLGSADAFGALAEVAAALGASLGATRVVTDAGWVSADRQIGTTGVAVNPRVYLAFGVSGAVQHTTGLGDPAHVLSVNTDPSCPMMTMADVAMVSDAPAVVAELARRLGTAGAGGSGGSATGRQEVGGG